MIRTMRLVIDRRSDTVALWIIYVTLAQLAVGGFWVKVIAQSGNRGPVDQAVVNERFSQRAQNLDNRVQTIEQMNLGVRIAVLERQAEDLSELRRLIYGVFLSLVGILIAQIVQIRGQRKLRRDES